MDKEGEGLTVTASRQHAAKEGRHRAHRRAVFRLRDLARDAELTRVNEDKRQRR